MDFFRKIKYTKLFRSSEDVTHASDDDFSPEKDRLYTDGDSHLEKDEGSRTLYAVDQKSHSWLRQIIHYLHLTLTLALIATLVALYHRRGPRNPIFPQMTYCKYPSPSISLNMYRQISSSCSGRTPIRASSIHKRAGLWKDEIPRPTNARA